MLGLLVKALLSSRLLPLLKRDAAREDGVGAFLDIQLSWLLPFVALGWTLGTIDTFGIGHLRQVDRLALLRILLLRRRRASPTNFHTINRLF